jgi:hypothetical protein
MPPFKRVIKASVKGEMQEITPKQVKRGIEHKNKGDLNKMGKKSWFGEKPATIETFITDKKYLGLKVSKSKLKKIKKLVSKLNIKWGKI